MSLVEWFRSQSVEGWMSDAACAGISNPEVFFPATGEASPEAKKICAGCKVRLECLDYALRNGERWGIWGGKNYEERKRIRRELARLP